MKNEWKALERSITSCSKCPRLRKHCLAVAKEKRRAYSNEEYWGKPVPGFGDPNAEIILLGLAPAAHGANRTGRMFTGDRSGEWLYRALFRAGLANQAESIARQDGLQLKNVYVTATARCAPPQNKPTKKEIENCRPFLERELELLSKARIFVGLGKIGFDAAFDLLKVNEKRPKFSHGAEFQFKNGIWLLGSYHPSQQNTFTGRLTEPMFDAIFERAKLLTKRTERSPAYSKPAGA